MLRLLSSVVLVLLFCEGEAEWFSMYNHLKPLSECSMFALKDDYAKKHSVMREMTVTKPSEVFVGTFTGSITYIEIQDKVCRNHVSKRLEPFAEIIDEGLIYKRVWLKFNLVPGDRDFKIIIRGTPGKTYNLKDYYDG